MDFGIMFFSSDNQAKAKHRYHLLLEATRFADNHGFCAVWTPERHFHAFGGLFANPAISSAGLATITEHIQLRAGSLISPLHHTIRIVEGWSMVDNFSNGRVALSFGAGWNVNDFVFFPERYPDRHAIMYEQIEEVRRLWRGEPITLKNSSGKTVTLDLQPKPIQEELPIWVTSSGNRHTFESAGTIGANLLTHLIGQDLADLSEKIAAYRKAREAAGYDPTAGKVALMLHTFLGEDDDQVRARVYHPFREYLRSAVKLEVEAARGGGVISGGHQVASKELSERDLEDLLDLTFERYYRHGSLLGTVDHCADFVWSLTAAGIDEVACLIDFIEDEDAVLKGLVHLNTLRSRFGSQHMDQTETAALSAFLEDLE